MKLTKFLEFHESDLSDPIKSFHIKDNLNDKVWNNFEIDQEIRESLLKIGQDFYEEIELEADVIDIILCGSLCNYNWSEKYSDYDVHIIIDYKDVNEDLELVEKLCDYAKKQWNLQHEITIKGFEVEVAIQNEDAMKEAIKTGKFGGVYSILKNKWVKKPTKIEFKPDEDSLRKKASMIMSAIDDVEEDPDGEESKLILKRIWKKIKKIRKEGLEKGGEFSNGNLIFKLLRRNKYISKIMDLRRDLYDKQFSKI